MKKTQGKAKLNLQYTTKIMRAEAQAAAAAAMKQREQADFEYWSKADTWTLEEGISLIINTDPRVEHDSPNLWKEIKLSNPFRDHYLLAERALEASKLNANNTPLKFISWAEQTGLTVPEELNKLVSKKQATNDQIIQENKIDTGSKRKSKNKYTPRGALGRLMLNLATVFAENRRGALIDSAEMLALLNKNGATVKSSDEEYVKFTDTITRKIITVSKHAFEGRLGRIRKHIRENPPT